MRALTAVALAAAVALTACGSDDDGPGAADTATDKEPVVTRAKTEATRSPRAQGTTVKAADSEFGTMLFGANDQAIYMFENDRRDESACYDECAEEWPPVTTKGEPQAGAGVEDSLLGTTKRRDGTLQVTYDGKPLYFYAHEAPGEVRCHNVDLNGGFWWVIGPDGDRLPA